METYISILITAWFLLQVTKSCKTHGGFYLGSIGGPAAVLASNSIKKVEVLEYPELGKFIQKWFMAITSCSWKSIIMQPV